MIQSDPTKFDAYHNFFETLWENSLDSSKVVSKISIMMQNKPMHEAIIKDYREFNGIEEGSSFFTKVCNIIENATSEIIALDVADLKEAVIVWRTNVEYQSFNRACIASANNQKKVTRIFVLTNFECLKLQNTVDIMIEQLESNINIGVIDIESCSTKQLFKQDFIIVDNKMGFKLEDDQEFQIDLLSLTTNLILKSKIEYYKNGFNKILEVIKETDHFFEGVNAIDKYREFIMNLKKQ